MGWGDRTAISGNVRRLGPGASGGKRNNGENAKGLVLPIGDGGDKRPKTRKGKKKKRLKGKKTRGISRRTGTTQDQGKKGKKEVGSQRGGPKEVRRGWLLQNVVSEDYNSCEGKSIRGNQ